MAKIKKGTYRFNDVLMQGGFANQQRIPLQYSLTATLPNGVIGTCYCDMIQLNADSAEVGMWYQISGADYDLSLIGLAVGSLFTVYHTDYNGWNPPFGDVLKTITITEDTEVSDEFYAWFTANTKEQKQISGKWTFKDVLTEYPFEQAEGEYVNFTCQIRLMTEDAEEIANAYVEEFYAQIGDREPTDEEMVALEKGLMEYLLANGGMYLYDAPMFAIVDDGEGGLYFKYYLNNEETGNYLYADGAWRTETYGEGIKTIDFGDTPQWVSVDYFNWHIDNTIPTATSVKAKMERLIERANATTGKADADLTSGVASLIEGYGGGGVKTLSGTWRFNEELNFRDDTIFNKQLGQYINLYFIVTTLLQTEHEVKCKAIELDGASFCLNVVFDWVNPEFPDVYATESGTLVELYNSGNWNTSHLGDGIKTFTFKDEQEVVPVFYDWFTANATKVTE